MMNTKIKQENSKAFPKFIIIVLVCAVLGSFGGYFSAHFQETLTMLFKDSLPTLLSTIAPFAFPAVNIPFLAIALVMLFSSNSQIKTLDQTDDVLFDKIEKKMTYLLLFTNICSVLNIFFFSINILYSKALTPILITIAWFIFFMAADLYIQQKIIDCEKTINPEKRGSIYDVNFNKKWEESCDEAQKLVIYKAAYTSYQFTSKICLILWLILQSLSLIMNIGILPIALVLFIWLTQILSYTITTIRLENSKFNIT